MSSNQFDENSEKENVTINNSSPGGHMGIIAGLAAGLIVALAGDAYLWSRANDLRDRMSAMQDGTQQQLSKLSEATTSLLGQRLDELNQQLSAQVKGVNDTTTAALKRQRADIQNQGDQLSGKLDEQQKQTADQIGQLKEATNSVDSKVDSKFSQVSTDVSGVKTDVSSVKADLATTQSGLDKTGSDLKRVMGDMGVMSGLIATNSKDLVALRELGERNYIEFDMNRKQGAKKIGDVTISLKNSDPKRNRYTVVVDADDKRVEKRDKTINEPIQLYVSGNRQPYEIVVNQVKKDEIVGYLSTPKVTLARQ